MKGNASDDKYKRSVSIMNAISKEDIYNMSEKDLLQMLSLHLDGVEARKEEYLTRDQKKYLQKHEKIADEREAKWKGTYTVPKVDNPLNERNAGTQVLAGRIRKGMSTRHRYTGYNLGGLSESFQNKSDSEPQFLMSVKQIPKYKMGDNQLRQDQFKNQNQTIDRDSRNKPFNHAQRQVIKPYANSLSRRDGKPPNDALTTQKCQTPIQKERMPIKGYRDAEFQKF